VSLEASPPFWGGPAGETANDGPGKIGRVFLAQTVCHHPHSSEVSLRRNCGSVVESRQRPEFCCPMLTKRIASAVRLNPRPSDRCRVMVVLACIRRAWGAHCASGGVKAIECRFDIVAVRHGRLHA